MKSQITVDPDSGLVHSLTATVSCVSDICEIHKPLHGEEEMGFVGSMDPGIQKRDEMRHCQVACCVGTKWGKPTKPKEGGALSGEAGESLEQCRAGIHILIERHFRILK